MCDPSLTDVMSDDSMEIIFGEGAGIGHNTFKSPAGYTAACAFIYTASAVAQGTDQTANKRGMPHRTLVALAGGHIPDVDRIHCLPCEGQRSAAEKALL